MKSGSVPKWLKASLDYSITGISKGSTVLEMVAPALGETAPSLIRQQDLWLPPPKPEDTAFTVLSKSVADASARRMDSERFDSGVLDALLDFRPLLQRYATEVTLSSKGRPKEHFSISEQALESISQLRIRTPEPQAVTVAGEFDLIEHSKGRFKLILEEGPILQGMVDQSHLSVEQMRDYWGKKVTVKGMAQYRPLGAIRLLEAQVIKPFEAGEEVFEASPQTQTSLAFERPGGRESKGRSFLQDIWGKWPGDETIDDLLAALKRSESTN